MNTKIKTNIKTTMTPKTKTKKKKIKYRGRMRRRRWRRYKEMKALTAIERERHCSDCHIGEDADRANNRHKGYGKIYK